jgi:hypothetical protein
MFTILQVFQDPSQTVPKKPPDQEIGTTVGILASGIFMRGVMLQMNGFILTKILGGDLYQIFIIGF